MTPRRLSLSEKPGIWWPEISTQSAAIGDNVTFTVKVDQQDNQLALEEDIDVVLTFAGKNVEGKDVPVSDVFEGFPVIFL